MSHLILGKFLDANPWKWPLILKDSFSACADRGSFPMPAWAMPYSLVWVHSPGNNTITTAMVCCLLKKGLVLWELLRSLPLPPMYSWGRMQVLRRTVQSEDVQFLKLLQRPQSTCYRRYKCHFWVVFLLLQSWWSQSGILRPVCITSCIAKPCMESHILTACCYTLSLKKHASRLAEALQL